MSVLRLASKILRNPRTVRQYLHYVGISIDPEGSRISKWAFGNIERVRVLDVFPGIENIDIKILGPFRRKINMSLDTYEVCVLCAISKFTGATRIVEIGTYDGNTTLNLAANSPKEGVIVTVDLPPTWKGNEFGNVADPDLVGVQFRNHIHACKIKQIFCNSADLDTTEIGNNVDLYFIDGCHKYDYVKKDTINALKCTRSGGLIVWHDYGYLQEVSRVVDEYAETLSAKCIQGTRLAIGFVP